MITPNKFIELDESVIGKMAAIIETLNKYTRLSINELYKLTKDNFSGIDEYIYSIDVLYILDRVEVNFTDRTIYVKRN